MPYEHAVQRSMNHLFFCSTLNAKTNNFGCNEKNSFSVMIFVFGLLKEVAVLS